MARITEEQLSDAERRRYRSSRGANLGDGRRAPNVRVAAVASGSALSLVLLVGGAGALMAPDRLPFATDLLAVAAVALGGWLAGRSGGGAAGSDPLERLALHRERADVIRAAVGLGLRGSDALVELARGRVAGPPGGEPGEPPAGGGRPRPHQLHALGGDAGAESLEPGADAENGV